MMTLAVMTRASLGHTGHDLVAGAGTQAIYAAVLAAAVVRVAAALFPAWSDIFLNLAAACWTPPSQGLPSCMVLSCSRVVAEDETGRPDNNCMNVPGRSLPGGELDIGFLR
jgi:hypothetical protein